MFKTKGKWVQLKYYTPSTGGSDDITMHIFCAPILQRKQPKIKSSLCGALSAVTSQKLRCMFDVQCVHQVDERIAYSNYRLSSKQVYEIGTLKTTSVAHLSWAHSCTLTSEVCNQFTLHILTTDCEE